MMLEAISKHKRSEMERFPTEITLRCVFVSVSRSPADVYVPDRKNFSVQDLCLKNRHRTPTGLLMGNKASSYLLYIKRARCRYTSCISLECSLKNTLAEVCLR